MIKPDAVQKRLFGSILQVFADTADQISRLHLRRLSRDEAELLYAEHKEKPFFEGLIEFTTCGPVIVGVCEMEDAVFKGRRLVEWVREEFPVGSRKCENLVHASDSQEAAVREIGIIFRER